MPESRELRLIAFRLGTETFVIDIMAVRQIMPWTGSTPVPAAPSFIEGVIVVRNEVIPVIDLHSRLYQSAETTTAQPLVLVCYTTAGIVGLKVDQVRRIITVSSDALLPAPAIVGRIRGDLLIAIIQVEQEVFLLLDLDQILTADEQRELQSADLSSSSEATSER
jgi:purine-binding chemotaxis protein CheW